MTTTLTVYDTPRTKPATGYWSRPRKAGVVYLTLGVLVAVLFGALAKAGADARFSWGTSIGGGGLSIPARAGAVGFGLLCALSGAALLTGRAGRWLRWLSGLALAGLVLSFLCWQVAGNEMPLGSTAQATVRAALPLVLGALCGVLCERSGVINVAIEGQLVIGVVLNVLALGLTGFLFTQLMQQHGDKYNFPPTFDSWRIPGLASIPILGPALFDTNIFGYLAIVLVLVVHFGLFRTRWGLRTRAVGEHPTAADTVGISVRGTRYRNVLLGGVIAGLGGASLTIGDVGTFSNNMSNGKGFIALAALIFGRWSPI